MTKVISAFPGTGKTYYAHSVSSRLSVMDLDSMPYTGGHDANGKVRNDRFPSNYLDAIKSQLGHVDVLLISIHKEVIDSLLREGVQVILIFPHESLKQEYLERFERRGSTELFRSLFVQNWDMLIKQLRDQKDCRHIVLGSGQYINDGIGSI